MIQRNLKCLRDNCRPTFGPHNIYTNQSNMIRSREILADCVSKIR